MLKFDNSYFKVNNLPLIKFINQLDDKINNHTGSLIHIDIDDTHLFLDIYDNVLTIYSIFLIYLNRSNINYIKFSNYDYNILSNLIELPTSIIDNNLTLGSAYIIFLDDNSFLFIHFDIQKRSIFLQKFVSLPLELDSGCDLLTFMKGLLR